MASGFSKIIEPSQLTTGGEPAETISQTYEVDSGLLTATWTHSSTFSEAKDKVHAARDRKISPHDFSPCYDDNGRRFLHFTSNVGAVGGSYILTSLRMQYRNAAGGLDDPVSIFEWHLVVDEWLLDDGKGRMSKMRDDRKVAKKRYFLANREAVDDSVLYPGYVYAKMAAINGRKYILEVDRESGLDLVGGQDDQVQDSGYES